MRLSELKTGESATILKVMGHGGFRRRILEMGFVRGQRIEVILNAPLKDPIEYKIMGYEVSLRRSESDMVVVLSDEEVARMLENGQCLDPQNPASHNASHGDGAEGVEGAQPYEEGPCDCPEEVIERQSRTITVALVGNPNSGKTSLFNAISGGREHVGNYSGVTVGAKTGRLVWRGYRILLTDLPGTYALSAYTPEERYVREHIADLTPDVIINAVVASNLERNLYLTTELIDTSQPIVVALNMFDELEASGATLDYDNLGRMLGVPMVPVEARNNKGIDALLDTVIAVYENRDERVRHIHIDMGSVIGLGLRRLNDALREHREELPKAFPPRYYALKLLEGDRQVERLLAASPHYGEWIAIRDREARHISNDLGEDVESAVTNHKYGFIHGALKETLVEGKKDRVSVTSEIDALVTHKLWGFPLFFAIMWLMFWCTFSLGTYPQEWIDALVGLIGRGVDAVMPAGPLRDMLVDGVIGGVGAVIVFLPNIMILYLFISFMEDSGYLARAAFIMDRVMHHIGLHGKSFIPLIMGFGCNVPAIMACRTIESRSSRLITIMITPFMSCSARLPIYILLTGIFFHAHAGLVMTGLYVLGIVLAMVTARLMRRFMFPQDETPFVMELPPYRLPTLRSTVSHMWDKCAQYLRKMGGMILIGSLVIWFLSYYPRETEAEHIPHYENSYLGRLGKTCEPVFSPLGLDWKASVALLSGVPAKEIVVSTLGVLYAEVAESADAGSGVDAAGAAANNAIPATGAAAKSQETTLAERIMDSGDFTTASALAFLVFILLYFPCIASIGAIGAEAGWRWAIAAVVYDTLLAWGVAWVVYNVASWL